MYFPRSIIVILILLLACTLPAAGVTTYRDASPNMVAEISGTNEFSPGQDAVISLLVQNQGVSQAKVLMEGNIDRDDNPSTAKMVTVGLAAGSAPVVIKTDPQNVGDIASQGKMMVKINAKITQNATEGEYLLPLTISYTYLAKAEELAADVLQNKYQTVNKTNMITIKIKPQVQIKVIEAVPDKLTVGTGGYITLTIKNTGFEDGKKATVKLLRSGNSPVIPTESNVFIGDFPRNGVVTARYKVSVSSEAENTTYPVDVAVTYENRYGDLITSAKDTIGIPVGSKSSFSVVSHVRNLSPGSADVIEVTYRNDGEITTYAAQARLSVVDPFSSTDNTAYLGDIRPGETATARYKVTVKDDAEQKEYQLDTEIRYRDNLENSQISDTFKVPVGITKSTGSGPASWLLPVFAVVVLLALCAGYYLRIMRKKQ